MSVRRPLVAEVPEVTDADDIAVPSRRLRLSEHLDDNSYDHRLQQIRDTIVALCS